MRKTITTYVLVGIILIPFLLSTSCNTVNKLVSLKLEIHTFGSADVENNMVWPKELQKIIQPFLVENCSLVWTNVILEDKIKKNNRREITIPHLIKFNDNPNFDYDNIKELWNKLLDPTDNEIPGKYYLLYNNETKVTGAQREFDYNRYYNKYTKDTAILFFILTSDSYQDKKNNIFNNMDMLKDTQTEMSMESPWKTVVICYKPETLPLDDNPIEKDCENGKDDDGDGYIDCEDPDCNCPNETSKEICSDGIDNDLDGLIDCADKEDCNCDKEICNNGIDDDKDGKVDCADADCDCPKSKDKCLIISSSGKVFKWNPIAQDVTYTYVFYELADKTNILASNTVKTYKTTVDLPKNIVDSKYFVLKVSCYRNGEFITDRRYDFYRSSHDGEIKGYCPEGQQKAQDCLN